MTPAEHAATVRAALEAQHPEDHDWPSALGALIALAERATELEAELAKVREGRDVDRRILEGFRDKAEARATELETALREVLARVRTRSTGIHMDGTTQYAQPILAEIDAIARAALGETEEQWAISHDDDGPCYITDNGIVIHRVAPGAERCACGERTRVGETAP